MELSDAGKRVFHLLYYQYSQEKSTTHTEEQIVASVMELSNLPPPIGGVSKEEQEKIVKKLMSLVGVIKEADEFIVDSDEYTTADPLWFTKIKDEHNDWYTAYQNKLFQKEWSPNVIREIDHSSDAIMNFLGNPKSPKFNVRGLVMGDVQSGKTANFLALCNKAADAGYKVIIVTAGIIEKLRRQTQERLEEEFISLLPLKQVVKMTDTTYDFKKTQVLNPVNVFREELPVLCVVKKNVSILDRLYKWLQKGVKTIEKSGEVKLPWPLLFIDDEADNASINTKELTEEANPTRTNELIRKILKSFARSSYVGITATPFANVFIDPDTEDKVVADDLFPKSFVYRLTPPSNYFGARMLFAPGAKYVEHITDIESWLPSAHKKDDFPPDDLPDSLRTAIGYFLLVNGVMDVTGESRTGICHRTMMIHVSRFITIQNRIAILVEEYVGKLLARISNYCGDARKAENIPELQELHAIWDNYALSRYCGGMQWATFLREYLMEGSKAIDVVTVNSGKTIKALDYGDDNEKRVIVIGGNTLSRGLTLQGLVVSYFRRHTLMSDTLLQMGRWCGYPGSRKNLVRVWMPEESVEDFDYACDISDALSEVFHQIVEQGGSPKDFAFKIRKSPEAMLPTARNKMRTAKPVKFPVVLAGHAIETPRLRNNAEVLAANDKLVIDFLARNFKYLETGTLWDNTAFYRNVPREEIVAMLSSFKAGMMSYGFMVPQIADYISTLPENWDVMIPIAKSPEEGFSANGQLPLLIRKAHRKLGLTASGNEIMIMDTKLKVTSGGSMRYILTPEEARGVTKDDGKEPSDKEFLERAHALGRNPLLVIQYVIKSKPKKKREKEISESARDPISTEIICMPLAADSFFALSFGFPGAKNKKEDVFYFTKRAYEEISKYEDFGSEEEV